MRLPPSWRCCASWRLTATVSALPCCCNLWWADSTHSGLVVGTMHDANDGYDIDGGYDADGDDAGHGDDAGQAAEDGSPPPRRMCHSKPPSSHQKMVRRRCARAAFATDAEAIIAVRNLVPGEVVNPDAAAVVAGLLRAVGLADSDSSLSDIGDSDSSAAMAGSRGQKRASRAASAAVIVDSNSSNDTDAAAEVLPLQGAETGVTLAAGLVVACQCFLCLSYLSSPPFRGCRSEDREKADRTVARGGARARELGGQHQSW
jgi:hypothetical protein